MKIFTGWPLFFLLVCLADHCCSQPTDAALNNPQPDSSFTDPPGLPSNYYAKVNKKITAVNGRLTKTSLKYLAKFQRQEHKLQQKLHRIHPELAGTDVTEKYTALSQKLKSKTAGLAEISNGEYYPYLDSLGTSLSFLKQFNGISNKVKGPLNSFNELHGNLEQSEKIKAFIAERKDQVKELLSKYTHLPAGLTNEYDKLKKTAYYYSASVKEYKDLLNDPGKMELKALSLLHQLPAFQSFVKEHSALAGLFSLPGNYEATQALAGLQTREQVQQLITNQVGGGANATQLFAQQLQAAQQQLQQFKDKLNKPGGGSGDIDMPDFKPQGQKTKSFSQRLEYGFNIQFARNNSFLPSTGDIAVSAGYKLNDKSVAGAGISYKLGIGSFQHIQITSQGIGLRSFLDYKIKKQFYISGGYEMNYNAAFKNIEQLKNYSAWQRSGLMGITKKYKVSKKLKGSVQVLYDFLARTHIPTSQPILFRTGYTFQK